MRYRAKSLRRMAWLGLAVAGAWILWNPAWRVPVAGAAQANGPAVNDDERDPALGDGDDRNDVLRNNDVKDGEVKDGDADGPDVLPAPIDVDLIKIAMSLGSDSGRPGDPVRIPLFIETGATIKQLNIALNFDEGFLFLREVRALSRVADHVEPVVIRPVIDNRDKLVGDQVREGFTSIELLNTGPGSPLDLPFGRRVQLLELVFQIRTTARPGASTGIKFESIINQEQVVQNGALVVTAVDQEEPKAFAEDELEGGIIEIIGEIGFFRRADVDLNCKPEMSDAIITLQYLFLGAGEPRCLDAADANDSGDIDLSDAVYTLAWLFNGGEDISEPFSKVGTDPTEDGLDCADGFLSDDRCRVDS